VKTILTPFARYVTTKIIHTLIKTAAHKKQFDWKRVLS